MTPEQQKIAIAQECEWIDCVFVESIKLAKGFPPPNNPPSYGTYENGMAQIPDYLNDLNAMHEAEQMLWRIDWSNRYIFTDNLANTLKGRVVNRNEWDAGTLLDATAAQRAEAFLKTIGKWTTNQNEL
jgi:hypothetical protein